jgi:hypothetical protein
MAVRVATGAREEPASSKSDEAQEKWRTELHDSDVSATGWAVAVLDAGMRAKLNVQDASLRGALDFLDSTTKTDGLVGYTHVEDAGATVTGPFDDYHYHVATMSSIGVLIRSTASPKTTDPFYDQAAKEILKDLPTRATCSRSTTTTGTTARTR